MQLIDGKTISEQIKQEISAEVAEIVANGGKRPHLAAILVGHDGGSETYVAHKVKACEQCGFKSTLIRHEDDITEEELLKEVEKIEGLKRIRFMTSHPKDLSDELIQTTMPTSTASSYNSRYPSTSPNNVSSRPSITVKT